MCEENCSKMNKQKKNDHDEQQIDMVDFAPNDYQYYIRDCFIVIFAAIGYLWDWVS